jgi:hypothetical protein
MPQAGAPQRNLEGRVTDVHIGDGPIVIVRFEDDTGSLYLVIPNYLQRHFAGGTPAGGAGPSGASPEIGAHARVAGKWKQKPMGEGWYGGRLIREADQPNSWKFASLRGERANLAIPVWRNCVRNGAIASGAARVATGVFGP